LSWPVDFGVPDSYDTNVGPVAGVDYAYNQWIVGVVNAAPYIASAFIGKFVVVSYACHGLNECSGCWLSDPLNNYFGRRGTIFFSAVFCLLSVIGSAFTQNWGQLFACRCLLGIGMGSKASTVPIFSAENVPAPIRGGLVMVGLVLTFSVCVCPC